MTFLLSKDMRIFIMKKKQWFIALFLVFLCLFILTQSDFFKVDSCLDNGGAWDEVNQICKK